MNIYTAWVYIQLNTSRVNSVAIIHNGNYEKQFCGGFKNI